jgi:glucokinase
MFLIADIGGTKINFALVENKKFLKEKKLYCKEFNSFNSALFSFLKDVNLNKIDKVCLAVAGPIKNNKCKITNLPWTIDAKNISKKLNKEVFLLNDLEASAYGIEGLSDKDFYVLNKGKKQKGNRAIISAGTGLGEAGIYFDGKKYHPFACEGGHSDFGARNKIEFELFQYLAKKFKHVSYEKVVSGPGLYMLYRFLVDTKKAPYSRLLEKEFLRQDPSSLISEKALKKENAICIKALDWFVSLYGAEAGNLALKFLATGGIFIGGAIALKILEKLKDKIFMKAFIDKGRFSKMLSNISVKVILNKKLPLLGCLEYLKKIKIKRAKGALL